MKNQNILVIGGIILFIFLYQFFVIAPHQEQLRQYERHKQEQLQAEESRTRPESPQTLPTTDTPTEELSIEEESTRFVDLNNPQSLLKLNAGPYRDIEVMEGGGLGRATLSDYYTRENRDEYVVLNQLGLSWQSSHEGVQSCLNSIRSSSIQRSSENSVTLAATWGSGRCEVFYESSADFKGLLNISLALEGFDVSDRDWIELSGADSLGRRATADQNYLSYSLDSSNRDVRSDDLFSVQMERGRLGWLSWGDRYFSLIFKPKGLFNPDLFFGAGVDRRAVDTQATPIPFALRYPLLIERNQGRLQFDMDFYFGTRDSELLGQISPDLRDTVELGWLASIARLMLWSLKSLNVFFNNFGMSIIALTLLVRLLFWPLNKKAYMSTIKMKELQPEMERIRKKYDSKDRAQLEKMNREIFALYRDKKVNPLGGCLPLLFQMPIFIGLYGALNFSVDLYQAPWMLWIHDLSLPDPFYVLSIAWTLSLLAYIKLNPQAMNTNQPGMPNMKWIFIGMNLFFGFLSKDWPSGLVLYLLVSNCVGLGQQFFLLRSSKKLQAIKEGA